MTSPDENFQYQDNNPDIGKHQADELKKGFSERYALSVSKLGVNDSTVAKRAGVPRSAISRYRNGESLPEARYIFGLADTLRVEARWLLTGEGKQQSAESVTEDGSGEGQMVSLFRSLPNEERSHLLKTASYLWNSVLLKRIQHVTSQQSSDLPSNMVRVDFGVSPAREDSLHDKSQSYTPPPKSK